MAVKIESSEHDEGRELTQGGGLDIAGSLARGEIDMQIRTARAFPRSIKAFMEDAASMACLNEEVATACLYALPRAGKTIEGPSARLAEICASAWGNCRAGARVIAEEDRFVVANGGFYDLERNVAVAFEVRRRITDRNNRRYDDDMIAMTGNAACSIALRNAVFKGIPKAFWGPVYEAARETARGKHVPLEMRRQTMLAYYAEMGVAVERILAAVGKPSIHDLGEGDILTLRAAAQAIKEQELTVDSAFPPLTATPMGSRTDHLAQVLATRGTPPPSPTPTPAPTPPAAPTEGAAAPPQPPLTVSGTGSARRTRRDPEGGLPGLG